MLVLSRRRGEAIVIDDRVTVTVLELRGDRVKLGFTGPADVPIHRQEVHQRIGGGTPVLKYAGCA
jgi:carbon storage regulator